MREQWVLRRKSIVNSGGLYDIYKYVIKTYAGKWLRCMGLLLEVTYVLDKTSDDTRVTDCICL